MRGQAGHDRHEQAQLEVLGDQDAEENTRVLARVNVTTAACKVGVSGCYWQHELYRKLAKTQWVLLLLLGSNV